MTTESRCLWCDEPFPALSEHDTYPRRPRKYCSRAHMMKDYRLRKGLGVDDRGTKPCLQCGTPMDSKKRMYCSQACNARAWRRRQSEESRKADLAIARARRTFVYDESEDVMG